MQLPNHFQFRVPSGFSETLAEVAEREGTTASEFSRWAILADIELRKRGDDDRPARDNDSPQQQAT